MISRICGVLIDCDVFARLGGVAMYMLFDDGARWEWWHYVAWIVLILAALELLSAL
jgi:hypothetical protein